MQFTGDDFEPRISRMGADKRETIASYPRSSAKSAVNHAFCISGNTGGSWTNAVRTNAQTPRSSINAGRINGNGAGISISEGAICGRTDRISTNAGHPSTDGAGIYGNTG